MASGTPWNAKLRGVTVFQDGEQVEGGGRVSGLDFVDSIVTYDVETGRASVALGAQAGRTLVADQPTLPGNVPASGPALAIGEVEFGPCLEGARFLIDAWCEVVNGDVDDPIGVSGVILYNGGSLSTTGPIEVAANGRASLVFRAFFELDDDDASPEFTAGVTGTAAGCSVVACTVQVTRAAVAA